MFSFCSGEREWSRWGGAQVREQSCKWEDFLAGGEDLVSRHLAATEGLALRCPCAMCRLSSSPTCVDATQQCRGKPTKSKDCGIMGFGVFLLFGWVFFQGEWEEKSRRANTEEKFLGSRAGGRPRKNTFVLLVFLPHTCNSYRWVYRFRSVDGMQN